MKNDGGEKYPEPAQWMGGLPPGIDDSMELAYPALRHDCASSPTGWMEVIEVTGDNLPTGKSRFLVYRRPNPVHSEFAEFVSLKSAHAAFNYYLNSLLQRWEVYTEARRRQGHPNTPSTWVAPFPHRLGFIRQVNCGALRPWFYARAGEALVGDYVSTEIEQGRIQRLFVMSKLLVGSNGLVCRCCEQPGLLPLSARRRTFSVLLEPNESARVHKLDDSEVEQLILREKLGMPLCDRHLEEDLDPVGTIIAGHSLPVSLGLSSMDTSNPVPHLGN